MSHTKYICIKCNKFETKNFGEIKKHNLRVHPCKVRSDVILLSEDQLFTLTLIPYINNKHLIDLNEINHLSKSNTITENKIELFNELDTIHKNKIKTCKYCNNEFDTIYNLKKHIIIKCFYEELVKKNKNSDENVKINNTIDSHDTINNPTNSHNTTNNIDKYYSNSSINIGTENNITNNLTNNLYFNLPVPFEEEWDISKIASSEKNDIMISQFVFSRFLNEILKNDKNSNVIIDKDNESGKVYMNHNRQYIEMTEKDILMKTMEKLYDQLYDLIENNRDSLKSVKEISKDYIHDKYNKYCKDTETNNEINEVIIDTYNNSNETAQSKYNNIKTINENKTKKYIDPNIVKPKNMKENMKDNVKRNKTETLDNKSRIKTLISKREEDMYYLYDSDGNTKA